MTSPLLVQTTLTLYSLNTEIKTFSERSISV
jgi:hypothetical protein